MFAWQPDGCRVRAFIARFFRKDYLVADCEMLEARIEHAVFVKVYLAAIRGLDEAAAFPREEFADFRMRSRAKFRDRQTGWMAYLGPTTLGHLFYALWE